MMLVSASFIGTFLTEEKKLCFKIITQVSLYSVMTLIINNSIFFSLHTVASVIALVPSTLHNHFC